MLLTLSVVDAARQIAGDDAAFIARVAALDGACRRRGVQLTFQNDMHLYREVFTHLNDPRAFLSPSFDARTNDLSEARWLLGRDADGQVVSTQAYRFYEDDGSTSYDRFVSLRMFHHRPEETAAPDEACAPIDDAIEPNRHLRSWITSGGTWVHPKFRGPDAFGIHLSELLPRLSRAIGMRQYTQAAAVTGLVSVNLAKAGVGQRYGHKHIAPMITYSRDQRPWSMFYVWTDRDEVEVDSCEFDAQLKSARAYQAAE
ncbi:MAG: hypothetical protein FJX54_16110 [Alphaproteobacteria bacterium]|nr:hypothetical protein [Alphaproteobacteria bacterium]